MILRKNHDAKQKGVQLAKPQTSPILCHPCVVISSISLRGAISSIENLLSIVYRFIAIIINPDILMGN
jgi:hypothetical protein